MGSAPNELCRLLALPNYQQQQQQRIPATGDVVLGKKHSAVDADPPQWIGMSQPMHRGRSFQSARD
ncbi:GD11541 [Drosophila simulans]|uniref:GD11541 n=1 Tax=Drosophila simulans TaxID=7240 RepID=B4QF60_DROSI|nr:GD11541 [Drosophila simulans]